jgi:hypothetical protein
MTLQTTTASFSIVTDTSASHDGEDFSASSLCDDAMMILEVSPSPPTSSSSLSNKKRTLGSVLKASDFCFPAPNLVSTRQQQQQQQQPSLGSLTYEALLRGGETSSRMMMMSRSLPALHYCYNNDDKECGDDDDDDSESPLQSNLTRIADALQHIAETASHDDEDEDEEEDTLQQEEAAAASRSLYGYDNDDDKPNTMMPPLPAHAVPADAPMPFKRRRVMRRNSFVIPRGRGLVPGLLDLQTAGKFHFGANDGSET